MNHETRNLVAAICLSMAVLIGYQMLFGKKSEDPKSIDSNSSSIAVDKKDEPSVDITFEDEKNINKNISSEIKPSNKNIPRITIKNREIIGSLSLVGATIDDITLINYNETLDPDSKKITFLKKLDQQSPFYARFTWYQEGDKVDLPNQNTLWKSSNNVLEPGNSVSISWTNKNGIQFYQTFSIDENFMIKVDQKVINTSANEINLYPGGLIRRVGEPETTEFFILHEGPLGVIDGQLEDETYNDVREKKFIFESKNNGGWVGITDKYWMAAIVPNQNVKTRFTYRYGNNSYLTEMLGKKLIIPPKSEKIISSRLFSGAKKLELLQKYENELNIKNFHLAIDFGWFYFLTKPFFYALSWANDILGNFGLAILLITVIVKLVFFPLANKSYKSMGRMRVLSPQLQQLRERFGNDRQKMNQEMMALYKREKVNPAAGCLPILIQIPVFFALYKVLFVSIEMRQAPFFGWINDLSVADPTSIFNLFGLLPYSTSFLPDFLNLGVWPVLMGVTMVLQQKLNPKPPDPIQAKIFAWMPVAFTFLLATFPAGLVIYWTWNNLLSIAQQWVIMNKINKEKK